MTEIKNRISVLKKTSQNPNVNLKDDGYFIKILFYKFAFPTVIALLTSNIVTMINGIMAGNYFGESGLASIGICSPLFFLFATVGSLIGAGSAYVAAKYMSDNNLKIVNKFYSIALILAISMGLLISLAGIVFEKNIVFLLGGNAEIGALYYYRNYIPFGVFTVLIYVPMNFTRIDGKPKVGLYMFISMIVFNVLANFILVTYFKMGIEAIALGTAIGALAASVTGFIFLMGKTSNIRFSKVTIADISQNIIPISVAGSPMALNNSFSFIKTLTINGLLIRLGASSFLPTIAVIWALNSFAYSILSGFGQAIVPLIAVFNEEKDNTSMRQIVKHALISGLAIFITLNLGLIIFWRQNFALFGLKEVGQNDQLAILCFALSLIVSVITIIIAFYFNGSKNIWLANIITLGRGVLFILPLAFVLSAVYGLAGIWYSFLLAEIFTVLLFLICSYAYTKRKRNLSFPLLMDKEWGINKKYISFSVANNPDAIANAAEKVSEFCSENELSPKQTMLIGLSIEEILELIRTSLANKVSNSTSVRILFLENSVILRIRYAGEKFNPIDYYRTNISEDIEKSMDVIGIKYIVNTAKKVNYLETFGINNLIIEL